MNNDDEIQIEKDSDIDDSVVAEENATETIKKLRAKLVDCGKEKQEYLTGWQRAKADLINARKRDEEDRKHFVKFANEDLVSSILPVLEGYEMASANREVWEKVDKNWRVGIEQIFAQLMKILAENGLEEVNPINAKYDHNRDEAVGHEETADQSLDQTITKVVQKGYNIHGRAIKAPKVIVAEYKK